MASVCADVLRGYEAAAVDIDGQITAAQTCRPNAYCTGDVQAPGFTPCERGLWTRAAGAYSAAQCWVPPGLYLPADGGNITKCPVGSYRGTWDPANSAQGSSCTPCGEGIYSQAVEVVTVYDPATNSTTEELLATSTTACCEYRGCTASQTCLRQQLGFFSACLAVYCMCAVLTGWTSHHKWVILLLRSPS